MKTPEYPEGRQIVLVGNDCTFMSGSFGVKEDDFYHAVSQYARQKGLLAYTLHPTQVLVSVSSKS